MSGLLSRLAEPFVELYHEVRGSISPPQRAAAMALQKVPALRDEDIGQQLARLLAPWWGFAAWGGVYAMTVMALAAVFFTEPSNGSRSMCSRSMSKTTGAYCSGSHSR